MLTKLFKEKDKKMSKGKEINFGDALIMKSKGFEPVCEDGKVTRFERVD